MAARRGVEVLLMCKAAQNCTAFCNCGGVVLSELDVIVIMCLYVYLPI